MIDRMLIFAAGGLLLCVLFPRPATCIGVLIGWGILGAIEWVNQR